MGDPANTACLARSGAKVPVHYLLGEIVESRGGRTQEIEIYDNCGTPLRGLTNEPYRLDADLVESLGGLPEGDELNVFVIRDARDCYEKALSSGMSVITKGATRFFDDAMTVANFCGVRTSSKVMYKEEMRLLESLRSSYAVVAVEAKRSALRNTQVDRDDEEQIISGTKKMDQDVEPLYLRNLINAFLLEARVLNDSNSNNILSWFLIAGAMRIIQENDGLIEIGSEDKELFSDSITGALKFIDTLMDQHLFNMASEILSFVDSWREVAIELGVMQNTDRDRIITKRSELEAARLEFEVTPNFDRVPPGVYIFPTPEANLGQTAPLYALP